MSFFQYFFPGGDAGMSSTDKTRTWTSVSEFLSERCNDEIVEHFMEKMHDAGMES